MPFHVLHILTSGDETSSSLISIVSALARRLDPDRYRLHAWFMFNGGQLADELRSQGVEVRVIPWRRGTRDPAGASRFYRALRSEAGRYSIVHEHVLSRSLRCMIRAVTRARLISHLHVIWYSGKNFRPKHISNWGAHCVISTSRAAGKTVRGARVCVIYPGIPAELLDCDVVSDRASSSLVIGTAGRLVPVKGFRYLIQAMVSVLREIPCAQLEIAGDGPLRCSLEAEARSLGVANNVKFLGWDPNLIKTMRRWDVYAQPSILEAFGLAALEAMAVGLPVVAAAAGGLPELVVDGETGWQVPPCDPKVLGDRIIRLLHSPDQRRTFGAASRRRAMEHFGEDRMVEQISDIYDDLLGPAASWCDLRKTAIT